MGFAEGGLLVDPAHNLKYVAGSLVWSGVIPMAIIGVARSYGIDFSKYLTPYGMQVYNQLQKGSIVNALGQYPGLTWQKMAKPQYANPDSVPRVRRGGEQDQPRFGRHPDYPRLYRAGRRRCFGGDVLEPQGIGTGDGVMVAGDVRALARQYCATGDGAIKYDQFDLLSHTGTAVPWAPLAMAWLDDRFAGRTAPSNCGWIGVGNSLRPEVVVGAGS